MARHIWQAPLAVVVWALVMFSLGVPVTLAILIPADVALIGLATFRGLTSRRILSLDVLSEE